ncbi:MAG: hypothetical protein QNJ36_09755 [Calothrix sp. MO_167.B42]|nr:hypothetical protein [Calothrix sp. MO_167.B42]
MKIGIQQWTLVKNNGQTLGVSVINHEELARKKDRVVSPMLHRIDFAKQEGKAPTGIQRQQKA